MTAEQDRCPSRIAHESGVVLRCQDVPGHVGNHVTVREQWTDDNEQVITDWPDQPTDADTAVEQLEVHHAQGRKRTEDEQAAVDRLAGSVSLLTGMDRAELDALGGFTTGGVVESGVDGDNPPSWLTTGAYDSGGFLPPGLAWYRNDTGHAIQLDPTKPLPGGVARLSEDLTAPKFASGGAVRSGPSIVGDGPKEATR